MSILSLRGVSAAYGPINVLHDVSLEVPARQAVVVLGANGAGKTTTLRSICGITNNRGSIVFDGAEISRMATADIVRRGVAHVPQGRGTFADLTVRENLDLGAYLRRDKAVRADIDRCFDLFPRLSERATQAAGSLSGGEQQMLAIARGLMLRPKLLVLDEPSLGLAPIIVRDLFDTLATLRSERELALLIVEQNADLALAMADHAYVLEAGSIVFGGPSEVVRQNDTLRRAYLGY
ncbi:ABC transporter ATP-binding protein [Acrocarpospora pleiomorpha]|uniref:ABC transporter ATP-binding protein n=1 Tax=Acrocarpospora pleiomorpha TaxID=90975 RepID=A0A5M3XT36_9ACTN|nr:ABC transporter ATP-binding protein [Acrocarpospora pleiomorpha]GES21558.1 ABC transporter ATP-binding protein [Acrocarpospora pleiomorpha]